MQMIDILTKKRHGEELTDEEIRFFVQKYTSGEIPDYQASAFTMAVCFEGMNQKEIFALTEAMIHSGETVDLSSIRGVKIDKHSTGGVGDKTSLVLGPLVASCGAKVAKMSGRGLGHTGGTLDKLESIAGLSVSVERDRFISQVNRIGIAIIGQTGNLVPADKKLYALRDVTATVDSIPLIASSIMSKKLASGADTILLDVKFGSGAFMKDIDSARELAETMVGIGKRFGKDTRAVLTDMNQPLGRAVGNSLEVIEAAETLKGRGPTDLEELCLSLGAIILDQANIEHEPEKGKAMLREKIRNGEAFEKLKALVSAEGGNAEWLEDYSLFPAAEEHFAISSEEEGYIASIDALSIGEAAMHLGAGRATKEDEIDMSAGIVLEKKVGDYVRKGEILFRAYTNRKNCEAVLKDALSAFKIKADEPDAEILIYEVIR